MTAIATKKRPQNVTLSADLVVAAQGLEQSARTETWRDDNRAALDAANRHVERHGLPLGKYCQI